MDTSVAARPTKSRAETLRDMAMEVFVRCPAGCTTHEIAAALDLPVSSIQPRISELKADRKIIDAGIRRTNESGKKAAVFKIPPPPGPPVQLSLFGETAVERLRAGLISPLDVAIERLTR